MAFQCLENIILLFLQILMSLLNLLIHGVISDEKTSSRDSARQERKNEIDSSRDSARQERNNEIDFSFSNNNRQQLYDVGEANKQVSQEDSDLRQTSNELLFSIHRSNSPGYLVTKTGHLEQSFSCQEKRAETKRNYKSNGSELANKKQLSSVISKINACLSKTRNAPLHQFSFLEFPDNKTDQSAQRLTSSKPLSSEDSTSMKNATNSNTISEKEYIAIATNARNDPENKDSIALFGFRIGSSHSINCNKANLNKIPKKEKTFPSTQSLIDNKIDDAWFKDHIENRVDVQSEDHFVDNVEEMRDNAEQSEIQSLSQTTRSTDEIDSTFTALYSKAEELRGIFKMQRSENLNHITDLDNIDNSDSQAAAFKMRFPSEIMSVDSPTTAQNDAFSEINESFASPHHTFEDVSTEEFLRTSQETEAEVPSDESPKPKRVKHRWRKFGNPNENPDLVRDRIYALKRKEYRRKNITENKENQGYDSGIDEPYIADHVPASSATWNDTVDKTGATNNGGHHAHAGRYLPQQRTWDKLKSQEIGQPDCRINDKFYTAANATSEERNFQRYGNETTNMSAIEFLMSLQHQGNKHTIAENTRKEHQRSSSKYLEDDAIVAMSGCGTDTQNRQQHRWADSSWNSENASRNNAKHTDCNNTFTESTGLAWTVYDQPAEDRSLQGSSPANGSSTRFGAEYSLYAQDQASSIQFEGTEYGKALDMTDVYVMDDTDQFDSHLRSRTKSVTSEKRTQNNFSEKRIKHRWRKYGNPNENPNLVRDRIYALRRREKDERYNRNSS